MSHFRRFPILLSLPLCALACVPRGTSAPSSALSSGPRTASPVTSLVSPISRDIDALSVLVTLPRHPQGVVWQKVQIGGGDMGPSDFKVRAVLLFRAADLKRIAKRPSTGAAPPQGEVKVESWFPQVLKKKAVRDASGQFSLRCARLVPDAFFKNSLRNGDLLQPTGTRYVILSLFTT